MENGRARVFLVTEDGQLPDINQGVLTYRLLNTLNIGPGHLRKTTYTPNNIAIYPNITPSVIVTHYRDGDEHRDDMLVIYRTRGDLYNLFDFSIYKASIMKTIVANAYMQDQNTTAYMILNQLADKFSDMSYEESKDIIGL